MPNSEMARLSPAASVWQQNPLPPPLLGLTPSLPAVWDFRKLHIHHRLEVFPAAWGHSGTRSIPADVASRSLNPLDLAKGWPASPGEAPRTHCFRAWFLLLKYRINFFRMAWFLEQGTADRISTTEGRPTQFRPLLSQPAPSSLPLSQACPAQEPAVPVLPLQAFPVLAPLSQGLPRPGPTAPDPPHPGPP